MTPLLTIIALFVVLLSFKGHNSGTGSVGSLVSATEIAFHRNRDEDTSLPLSSNYRANLRRLCDLLKQAETNPKLLPPEWQPKKSELKALCAKLQKDDKMTQTTSPLFSLQTFLFGNKLVTLSLVLGGLGACVVFNVGGLGVLAGHIVQSVLSLIKGWGKRTGEQGREEGRQVGQEDILAAREARLRRFEQQ
ncbi:hypothetical protein EON65_45375 [archaeon]|nr:MAG: hypothetical protein EON65_45375 [archaeon]